MSHGYPDPVARLLDHGAIEMGRIDDPWPDYLALDLSRADVPELVRMAEDAALNNADPESLEVWAPLHAWRALAQLGAVEAAPALVRLLQRYPYDDWLARDLPRALAQLGPATIPAIAEFLADAGVEEIARISAPACLERIAADHPTHREACVRVLERQLGRHAANGPALNGFLVASLLDLEARESIGAIRAAFAAGDVDLRIAGDLEEAEIALGLRTARITPRPGLDWFDEMPGREGGEPWLDDSHDLLSPTAINPLRHVGRNDPCPCGSGRKFKRCCGGR